MATTEALQKRGPLFPASQRMAQCRAGSSIQPSISIGLFTWCKCFDFDRFPPRFRTHTAKKRSGQRMPLHLNALEPHRSGAGRWQKLQSVFVSNLKHARNIQLLVRTQCADFLEESFEARRGDDTHKTTGRLAEVTVGMRYSTWRKNCRALLRDERLSANSPLVFAFEDLEGLVFSVMDVRWRTAARQVVRLDRADHAARVAAVDANDHWNTKDVYLPASGGGGVNGLHNCNV